MTNTATTHRFTLATWVDSKSNRRDRTYVIDAATANEAIDQARSQAMRGVRQNVTVVATITDVDGLGGPVDCPHAEAIFRGGFQRRWDGGRECRACVAADDAIEAEAHRTAPDHEGA